MIMYNNVPLLKKIEASILRMAGDYRDILLRQPSLFLIQINFYLKANMFHCYNYRCRENNRPLGSNEKPLPQAQLKRVAGLERPFDFVATAVGYAQHAAPPVVHLCVVRIVKLLFEFLAAPRRRKITLCVR